MIGESILQLHEGNAVDENIKSYESNMMNINRLLAPNLTVLDKLQ